MEPDTFSPKAFLKARRPERFSDTVTKESTELDRSLLEYHIDSLTSRSQETEFERFARRLCEREVCPNLLPQTGPTGGGDSKVDSETYPVSEELALAWYVGVGSGASSERWAFAFSAKADWAPKLRSDIAKIVETDRGYTKAFFVTNQAVPDRKRAKEEDDLRKEHGIDVRVLDRTWLLDRVFEGNHEAIAVEELSVTALSRQDVKKGPLDTRREEELEEAEAQIREALQEGRYGTALVDHALESAALARELERPRTEVEGRFTRADQMANEYGTLRQRVEVAYQWAWTLFWWFEDYDTFANQYSLVVERATGSRNVHDLERVTNLWYLLHGTIRRDTLDEVGASYTEHTDFLVGELERLCDEEDRPSTALQAETLLHQVGITRRLAAGEPLDEKLRSLQDVVLRSEGLVGYPLEPLVNVLTEIGEALESSTAYDELFETIVQVSSTRDGEVRAARLLLKRGEQQLFNNRPVEAIATLGSTLSRLYKHETRQEIVRALYLCGCAYDEIGLPWAARGTLLAAASIATNELWTYGDVTPYQAACCRRLKWIELRLGRIPHLLAWHEIDRVVREELSERGYDSNALFESEDSFQGVLGSLLLRTGFSDLRALHTLPDVLDRLDLPIAADSLLFALGHEDRLREAIEGMGEDFDNFLSRWLVLPTDVSLAAQPDLCNKLKVSLSSRVLGCRVKIESKTESPCLEVAESMLAALESFLATSALDRAIAREPELTVEIRGSDLAENLISVNVEERAGRPHLEVRCRPFDPHGLNPEQQNAVREDIFNLTVTALSNIVTFKDFESDIDTLFRDERVADRAVAFTGTFSTQANVLGASPKTQLASWIEGEAHVYPVVRTQPWDPPAPEDAEEPDFESEAAPQIAEGYEPPAELLDPNARRHDQIKTVSLIRVGLWDRAEWSGTAFFTDPSHQTPPVLALVFSNREPAQEIFTQWREELGKADEKEQLRITLVRGIDTANPHAYRVIVGSDPSVLSGGTRFASFASRINRMDATNSENLDYFLQAHEAVGESIIAPAYWNSNPGGAQVPELERNLGLRVRNIHVRQAWEIGPNELEVVAIHEDDDPILPKDVDEPPVLSLLRSPTGVPRSSQSERSEIKGRNRNDPCPCGSGRKYKKCCGAN